jgi:hypothetical protein
VGSGEEIPSFTGEITYDPMDYFLGGPQSQTFFYSCDLRKRGKSFKAAKLCADHPAAGSMGVVNINPSEGIFSFYDIRTSTPRGQP